MAVRPFTWTILLVTSSARDLGKRPWRRAPPFTSVSFVTYFPTHRVTILDLGKRPWRCAPFSNLCPLVLHCLFSSSASPPTWSGKAAMAVCPPFKYIFPCLFVTFISLVWESGHGGAPPFQVSFFRLVSWCVGYPFCPSRRQRPLRCALLLGFTRPHPVSSGSSWRRIDSFSGRESGHGGSIN